MPVHFNPEIGPPPRRLWSILVVSGALHALILVMLIFGWLYFGWNETIWTGANEFEKPIETVMLAPLPIPAVTPPAVETIPAPPDSAPPEISPPSPPVPQALPPPPPLIRPDDLIAEGARPEASPRASRGNTPVPARPGPTELPRLLPAAPVTPIAPLAPVAPGPLPEPLRLPALQPPLRTTEALPAPPEPPLPAPAANPSANPAPNNNDPSRNGVQLPSQIAQNSSALTLPRLGNGRASSAVDTATQGISSQMAQRPANVRTAAGTADRTGNSRGLEQPNFNAEEPLILSDTRGYDFGPYLNQVVNIVRRNWYSLIPESVRYNGQRGNVVLTFTIVKSGAVQDLVLRATSGKEPLDRAAMGSITASNPFQSLPPAFVGDHLTLQFTFLYNVPKP